MGREVEEEDNNIPELLAPIRPVLLHHPDLHRINVPLRLLRRLDLIRAPYAGLREGGTRDSSRSGSGRWRSGSGTRGGTGIGSVVLVVGREGQVEDTSGSGDRRCGGGGGGAGASTLRKRLVVRVVRVERKDVTATADAIPALAVDRNAPGATSSERRRRFPPLALDVLEGSVAAGRSRGGRRRVARLGGSALVVVRAPSTVRLDRDLVDRVGADGENVLEVAEREKGWSGQAEKGER